MIVFTALLRLRLLRQSQERTNDLLRLRLNTLEGKMKLVKTKYITAVMALTPLGSTCGSN